MSDFKVVCISNIIRNVDGDSLVIDLEIGKVYEVTEYDETNKDIIYYQIQTHCENEYAFYHIYLFKRLDEFRNERLSEIGI
jgi:hypothetical protein